MLREGAHWTVHVVESPEMNAWIAPGGHIFVNTGLLKAVGRDDNMLAFVLAHEMGHQLARHAAEKATLEMLKGVYQTFLWGLAATLGADFFGGVFLAGALVGGLWIHLCTHPPTPTLTHKLPAVATFLHSTPRFKGASLNHQCPTE